MNWVMYPEIERTHAMQMESAMKALSGGMTVDVTKIIAGATQSPADVGNGSGGTRSAAASQRAVSLG